MFVKLNPYHGELVKEMLHVCFNKGLKVQPRKFVLKKIEAIVQCYQSLDLSSRADMEGIVSEKIKDFEVLQNGGTLTVISNTSGMVRFKH